LKGAALATTVYPELGLRPMGDLDLLIEKGNINRALQIIHGLGYRPVEEEILADTNREVMHTEYWRGGPNGHVGVELHWNLIAGEADDRTISADWFWEQVEIVKCLDEKYPVTQLTTLNPTAHLLYISGHMMQRHAGDNERLIWFYDVDQLVRTGRVDWKAFVVQAQALGWETLARYVLEGAVDRFGTPIPAGLPESITSEADWGMFLIERQKRMGHVSRLARTIQSLNHLPWSWRWRIIWALIFPSPRYLRWRYDPDPGWTWPLYYFFRWWEIAKEFFRWLFLAARHV
jgi:hypothetical protein